MSAVATRGGLEVGASRAVRRDQAARLLEQTLLVTIVLHAVAMGAMALLLLPGMPGGGATDAERVAYIAAGPWRWRLGWLPWQLTALSDLVLAIALLRTTWVSRRAALFTLATTVAAIIPDQAGQIAWVTRGIALAKAGDLPAYLAFEARIFPWTAGWGALLYTVGALGWTWCFVASGTWTRWLNWYSPVLWGLFGAVSLAPLLPASLHPGAALVSGGNALGFVLMLGWLVAVTELVLRRVRPDTPSGRYALWRHPRRFDGALWNLIANSRFARTLAEWLPTVAFLSDITDVIYVNYIVEAERLTALVPPGLELQRLGPDGRYAFFTFLSYRHGHFGPCLLGPLRRLLPSPVQTNWRIHVRDPLNGTIGVHFVTNAVDSTVHAIAARLLSEGMPMHALRRAAIGPDAAGVFHLSLDPGTGSAPDAEASLRRSAGLPTDGPWRVCFASYEEMLAYCVPQDRAFSAQPWYSRLTRQEIALGIPLESCEALVGEVRSRAAQMYVGDAVAFAFRVPGVQFRFTGEEYDRRAL